MFIGTLSFAGLFSGNIVIRAIIAGVTVIIMTFFLHFWNRQFLATANTRSFLEEDLNRKIFIWITGILPWFTGSLIIALFGLPHHAWSWMITIAGLL